VIAAADRAPAAITADDLKFFEAKVRPLLIDRCVECHGEKKQKAGLRLDSAVGWRAGGESGAVIDYRDWQVPLGRRFRALKLWFTIRHHGTEGLRALVRHHVSLAARLRHRIAADPALELACPTPWSLVCFRARAGDDATDAILRQVNQSGRAFLSHTRVDGRLVARVSVGAPTVAERHVDALWDLIRGAR